MEANILQYTCDALLLYLLQFRGIPKEGKSTILQAHMDLLNVVYRYEIGPVISLWLTLVISLCIRAAIEGASTALESVLASDSVLVSPESPQSLRSLSSLFSLLATQFKVDQYVKVPLLTCFTDLVALESLV